VTKTDRIPRLNGNSFLSNRRRSGSAFEKGQQVGVDLVCVGSGHAMWETWINVERCVLQNFRGHQTGSADWHNLIIIAVHDKHRNVDLLQAFCEVL
jgi:hypothetical protein